MRLNSPKNRMDLEKSWYNRSNIFNEESSPISNRKKQFLYQLFVKFTADSTAYHGFSTQLDLNFLKVKVLAVWYLGKTLSENMTDLPGGSSYILSNLRYLLRRLESPCLFILYIDLVMRVFWWIIVRKITLFHFLNIKIESMRDQYPESSDWEYVTKMLMWGSSAVPLCSYADDLIFIHATRSFNADS